MIVNIEKCITKFLNFVTQYISPGASETYQNNDAPKQLIQHLLYGP